MQRGLDALKSNWYGLFVNNYAQRYEKYLNELLPKASFFPIKDAIMRISSIKKTVVINLLSQQEILNEMSRNLDIWKEKYGVKRIGLFGSYSRGEQKESSDIDVLVEFMDHAMTFDNYMDLKFNLEDHFQKPVDLVILDDIKPALKPSVLRSAKYAERA